MKKIKIISIILLSTVIVLSGCNNATQKKGEDTMEEELLTKEEFIQAVQENDLGVTVEDFEGVDIDDFILDCYISQEAIGECMSNELSLRGLLDGYIRNLPRREREKQLAPYRVTELKYVESTDEEYQAFIDSYFEALQKDAEYLRQDEDVIDVYEVENYNEKSSWIDFSFCQTSKSKKLPLKYMEVGSEEGYTIEKKWEAHGIYNLDIFYSKSGKYLMYFEGKYEFETYEEWLHIIKTFCELED